MTTARITARAATRSAPNRPLLQSTQPPRTQLQRTPPRAHSVGRWGEELTARILERNWRPPAGLEHEQIRGELDLIAIDPEDELVFVEVKTRSSEDFGHPFASIDRDKARRTRSLAILWCRLRENLDFPRFRIDAIAVTGTCETFTFEHLKAVA